MAKIRLFSEASEASEAIMGIFINIKKPIVKSKKYRSMPQMPQMPQAMRIMADRHSYHLPKAVQL